ncbi:lysophospholipase L1-like esterase [Curtobacterium sp. PhB130]|uniref:SGNH/GDSL hydrolase family protein n=1 Tax=unclassified Curtobacterium TaxID=257496 RepID=UPI000F4C7956|nr:MULTISPECIES: SGNH/GDSL hydrolase family protein [unclassified Curtobacterium]ROS71851.1 lysophospholipase L1-like esterase [Curtobacterium sp. PhB130]TCK58245.1 lysophospholipase L1-like esterase [Curtobacterium sp. PhB136]
MTCVLHPGDRLLFIGDSITDSGRDRDDPTSLGSGYPALVAEELADDPTFAGMDVRNRGIGGNRAVDLRERWEEDCLALQPTVLSLLIGVNDTWRRFDAGDITTAETFRDTLHDLIARAREGGVREIVLIEPFTLPIGVVTPDWSDDIAARIAVVHELADAHGALLVPAHASFARWATERDPKDLLEDGVHPTPLGHALLAAEWIRTVVGRGDA